MKKSSYGKEQELFAKYILEYIFKILVGESFQFKTFSGTYQLNYITDKGTTDGGSQLTDKIITLIFENLDTSEVIESFLYVESKAYFSQSTSSTTSIEKSFKKFYTDLGTDYGYASTFCIFKGGEKAGTYPLLDKLITDNIDCPDMYFEITKDFFLDDKFINTLELLFKESIKLLDNSKKSLLFEEYIRKSPGIILNLKKHLISNIRLSFSKYENSEKRLKLLLENRIKIDKNIVLLKKKADYNNGFKFECPKEKKDLLKAEHEQEQYLLNKYHYFDNPLIQKKILNIETKLNTNIFPEIEYNSSYSSLKECTELYINEFQRMTLASTSESNTLKYLFDGGSTQKRGFLFDSGAHSKILFHYQKNKSIIFINNPKNEK